MRIAHITDVHVFEPPHLSQVVGKRMLGTFNLYVLGRRHDFSRGVQEDLVRDVTALAPDALVLSGDVTAQATQQEFVSARALLAPLLDLQPSVVVPGNHDTYTRGACVSRRMERSFSRWMGEGAWPRVHRLAPDLVVLAIDDCRAHPFSSGRVPDQTLERLASVLAAPEHAEDRVLVVLHYPLRDHGGAPYGPWPRALSNARVLEAALAPAAERIVAILHGHHHRGFRSQLAQNGGRAIPILNPGTSGQAWKPERGWRAHFNLYTVDGLGVEVERYAYDGERGAFLPEAGGSYLSGF